MAANFGHVPPKQRTECGAKVGELLVLERLVELEPLKINPRFVYFLNEKVCPTNRDVAKITCCLHWSSPFSGGDQSFICRGMVSSLRRLELGPRPISSPA